MSNSKLIFYNFFFFFLSFSILHSFACLTILRHWYWLQKSTYTYLTLSHSLSLLLHRNHCILCYNCQLQQNRFDYYYEFYRCCCCWYFSSFNKSRYVCAIFLMHFQVSSFTHWLSAIIRPTFDLTMGFCSFE